MKNYKTVEECERCQDELHVSTMSKFNTDTICLNCSDREKDHPKYKEAVDADIAACRAGNYNFEGIGCPPELQGPEPSPTRREMMEAIRQAWTNGPEEQSLAIWAKSDGYGIEGFVPPQGYDWSGIRDSSRAAIRTMYAVVESFKAKAS